MTKSQRKPAHQPKQPVKSEPAKQVSEAKTPPKKQTAPKSDKPGMSSKPKAGSKRLQLVNGKIKLVSKSQDNDE